MSQRDDELDGLKIRQIAQLRRATYRSRSYAIIAAAACAVVGVQLGIMAAGNVRQAGWGIRPIAYLLILAGLLALGAYFVGRARELHREASAARLPEPSAPPNFTTLSDGSQQVSNLEQIRD